MGCPKSFEQHLSDVIEAFGTGKAGGGCEDTYKAVVELAEGLRVYHAYPKHEPGRYAEGIAAKMGQWRAAQHKAAEKPPAYTAHIAPEADENSVSPEEVMQFQRDEIARQLEEISPGQGAFVREALSSAAHMTTVLTLAEMACASVGEAGVEHMTLCIRRSMPAMCKAVQEFKRFKNGPTNGLPS